MADKSKTDGFDVIMAEEVTLVTPTNQAIYEAGKSMLIESINVGREFCKFMIGTAMSAIPVYMALLKFILPEKYVPTLQIGLLALVPAILFLFASVVFLIGYFPQVGMASLDLPSEIEVQRRAAVQRRYRLSIAGFSIFCIAVLTGLIITGYILRMPDRLQDREKPIMSTEQSSPSGAKAKP